MSGSRTTPPKTIACSCCNKREPADLKSGVRLAFTTCVDCINNARVADLVRVVVARIVALA